MVGFREKLQMQGSNLPPWSSKKNDKLVEFIWCYRLQNIRTWTDKSKWHGERCIQLNTKLWYMLEFRNHIFTFHSCIRHITIFRFYQSKIWWKNTAIQPRHLNLEQVGNPQYQFYVCYFVHVLYCSIPCSFDITIGSSLLVTHCTSDDQVTSDIPDTP